jgi:magnesium transporter
LRTRGADYLAYALIDTAIDQFFPVLEALDDYVEELEDQILADPKPAHMEKIQDTRRELQHLRRATWPLRDLVTSLGREELGLIQNETKLHLRDCADHGMQILDRVEAYRDLTNSMVELYMSSLNQKLNEVMKVLTVMAAIFIPLTFIVGIYGMNFDPQAGPYAMPELRWHLGYPAVLLAMLVIALGMLGFFRWKRWL